MAARNANNLVKNALFALLILSFFAAPALAQWDFSGRIGYATERGSFSLIFGQQPDETANVFVRFFSQRVPLLINIRTFQYTTRQAGAPLWAMLLVFAAVFSLVYVLVKKVPMFKDSGNGRENKAPLVIFCLALSLMCVFLTPIPFIFLTFLAWIGAITGFGAGAVIFFSVCVTLLVWFLGSLGQAHKGVSDFKRDWRANRVEPKKRPRRDDGDDDGGDSNNDPGKNPPTRGPGRPRPSWQVHQETQGNKKGEPINDDDSENIDELIDKLANQVVDTKWAGLVSRRLKVDLQILQQILDKSFEDLKNCSSQLNDILLSLKLLIPLLNSNPSDAKEKEKMKSAINKAAKNGIVALAKCLRSYKSKNDSIKKVIDGEGKILEKLEQKTSILATRRKRFMEFVKKMEDQLGSLPNSDRDELDSIVSDYEEMNKRMSAEIKEGEKLHDDLKESRKEKESFMKVAQSSYRHLEDLLSVLKDILASNFSSSEDLIKLKSEMDGIWQEFISEKRIVGENRHICKELEARETFLFDIQVTYSRVIARKVAQVKKKIDEYQKTRKNNKK